MRIVDIEFTDDQKFCAILFRLVDREGQDAVYEHLESGEIDAHPKKPGQGNRLTAHLVVRLIAAPVGNTNQFNAILEVVPGIGPGLVGERLSGSVLAAFARGSMKILGEDVLYRGAAELRPFVDKTIREELSTGVLEHFTLIRKTKRSGGVDEPDYFKETERKIELDVTAVDVKGQLDKIWSAVKKKAGDENYELVKARYQSQDGAPVSANIDINRDDALEQLVSKHGKISLDQDMHPTQTKVDAQLMKKMIALLTPAKKHK